MCSTNQFRVALKIFSGDYTQVIRRMRGGPVKRALAMLIHYGDL